MRSGGQRQRPRGSPRCPHGHGFIAATSWNRAGNSACRAARDSTMWPALERLAQHLEHVAVELRQLVEEQHAVVRQRDLARPRTRRRRRPARRPTPCGAARETAAAASRRAGSRAATSERIAADLERLVLVESAAGVPGSRCASMLLPVPGGPISSRLCSPAAAISSARRAPAWPRTSARSGTARVCAERACADRGLERAAPAVPRACRQTSRRCAATKTRAPRASAASRPLAHRHDQRRGRRARACSALGSTPRDAVQFAAERQLAVELDVRRMAPPATAPTPRGCRPRSAGRTGRLPSAGRPARG